MQSVFRLSKKSEEGREGREEDRNKCDLPWSQENYVSTSGMLGAKLWFEGKNLYVRISYGRTPSGKFSLMAFRSQATVSEVQV